jgi:predicted nucleic acid-binding protein
LALYYLETSALVKLYIRELGTERLLELAARANQNQLVILALARIEFRSAVRRRERNGEIATRIATQLLELFQRHVEARFRTQPINDFVLDIADRLVDRYGLRAFDAMQLAGFLACQNSAGTDVPTFVCADAELLSAATREGCITLDPCS